MKKIITLIFFICTSVAFSQVTQQQVDVWKGTATGTNNYSVTIDKVTATSAYDNQTISVKLLNAPTGASTLQLTAKSNTYPAINLTANGSALTSGSLSANVYYQIKYNASSNEWQIASGGGSGGGGSSQWTTSGSDIYNNNAGNVGIGITSPSAKLQVASTATNIATRPFMVINGAGDTILQLHSRGMIQTGTLEENLYFGYNSGLRTTTGTYNTSHGKYNLAFVTSGSYNTAGGHGSLYKLTTGNRNTAYGFNSLYNDTTGNYNTVMGGEGQNQNVSGSYNTSAGFASLFYNKIGSSNTAIGMNSLFNTKGSGNIGIGYVAGYYGTWNNKGFIDNQDRTDSATQLRKSFMVMDFGADSSVQQLRLNGRIKITGGNYGNGKVLTSDANGLASWQTPTTGTVTNLTGTNANGVSFNITTPTTTPNITLSLGDITPNTVNGNTINNGTGTLKLNSYQLEAVADNRVLNAANATNIEGGSSYALPYQSVASTTSFITAGAEGTILTAHSTTATPTWNTLASIGGVTGTGSNGRLNFWTGTSTQSSDANLFWDNTNKALLIGGASYGTEQIAITTGSKYGVNIGMTANSTWPGMRTFVNGNSTTLTDNVGFLCTNTSTTAGSGITFQLNAGGSTGLIASAVYLDASNSAFYASIKSGSATTRALHFDGSTKAMGFGLGITNPVAAMEIGHNMTAAAWGNNGLLFRARSVTLTNSSSSGTVTDQAAFSILSPAFASTNSITVTNPTTLYVYKPSAGTNTTLTNQFSLGAEGSIYVDGSVSINKSASTRTPSEKLDLVGNFVLTGQAYNPINTIAYTTTVTPNWDNSATQKVTLAGTTTIANSTNIHSGAIYMLYVYQDAGAPRTIGTWGSQYKFPSGVTPTLSTSSGQYDIITFSCDGTNLNCVGVTLNPQ